MPLTIPNSLVVSGGSAISGVATAIAVFILAKQFGASGIGELAVLISVTNVLVTIMTLRFEYAIAQAESHSAAADNALVGGVLALIISLPVSITATYGTRLLGNDNLYLSWTELIATSTCSVALVLAEAYLLRIKRFHQAAVLKVLITFLRLIVLFAILSYEDNLRLPLVYAMASASVLIVFASYLVIKKSKLFQLDPRRYFQLIKKNKNLIYTMPTTTFVNALSANAMPVALGTAFGPSAAGIYFFLHQMIGKPVQLLSQGIWKVGYTRLVELDSLTEVAQKLLEYFARALPVSLIGVPILIFVAKVLTQSSLGKEVALLVIAAFVVMSITNALSNTVSYFLLFARFTAESAWNIGIVVVRWGAIAILILIVQSPTEMILWFSLTSAVTYCCLLFHWVVYLRAFANKKHSGRPISNSFWINKL